MQVIFLLILACASSNSNPTTRPNEEATTVPWWEEIDNSALSRNLPEDPDAGEALKTDVNATNTKSEFTAFSPTTYLAGSNIPTEYLNDTGCSGPGTLCVPYYQCADGQVITDGSGLIDIRLDDTVIRQHSKCRRYLEVCCGKPGYNVTTTVQPPTPTCGIRNTEGVDARIIGLNDTQTQFGEFPWMMAVLRREQIGDKEVNLYLCGGSLIEPNIVLTAAHCVRNFEANDLKIRAGEWDTQSEYEVYPHQDQFVKELFIHPEYNGNSLWNDFAVLILKESLELTPSVNTICLPEADDDLKAALCIATGWGKDRFGSEGRFQNILKQVSLSVVQHGVCENALRTTRLGEFFKLDQSFLCAGGMKDVDTCKGDGGSPLVCPRTTAHGTVYFQAGIVAWGIGCGENGIPGVYANVPQAIDWIKAAIAPFI